MKSNREFLDGIYSKAKILEEQSPKSYKYPKFNYKFASLAAMIILIPTILFWKANTSYEDISSPMMIRNIDNSSLYFQEADFIVTGRVIKIYDSNYVEMDNYIYTDIGFKINEVLKGKIDEIEIVLRVNGGKVKNEKLKSSMDSEFIKGKSSLLFLIRDESGIYNLINSESQFKEVNKDLFIDKLGQEYSLEEIKNIIMEE